MSNKVTMYGADWCGDCRRSKAFMEKNSVGFTYIDVEKDESAADKVLEYNKGMKSILQEGRGIEL